MFNIFKSQNCICSVQGLIRENALVKLVIDGRTYKSRIENAARASEGLMCIAAPLDLCEEAALGISIEVHVPTSQALLVISATVIGKFKDGVSVFALRAEKITPVQLRKNQRIKTTFPVSYRQRPAVDPESGETIDLSTSGILIRKLSGETIYPGTIVNVSLTPTQTCPIRFSALVVEDGRKQFRLAIASIDSDNKLSLHRLCKSLIDQS